MKQILVVFAIVVIIHVKLVMVLILKTAQDVIIQSSDILAHPNAFAKVAILILEYNYAILASITCPVVILVLAQVYAQLVLQVSFFYQVEFVDAQRAI